MAHHSRDGEPGGTSRRSFLQTGAAAALAGGTLASPAQVRAALARGR